MFKLQRDLHRVASAFVRGSRTRRAQPRADVNLPETALAELALDFVHGGAADLSLWVFRVEGERYGGQR